MPSFRRGFKVDVWLEIDYLVGVELKLNPAIDMGIGGISVKAKMRKQRYCVGAN